MCDEAKESFAIGLTTSRCHLDEKLTGHRNEALILFPSARGPTPSLARPADGFFISGTSDPGYLHDSILQELGSASLKIKGLEES